MKIDKEKIDALSALPDDMLWKEVHSIAKSYGINLSEKTPSHEELNKLRSIFTNTDKINMFSAMRLINEYKRSDK